MSTITPSRFGLVLFVLTVATLVSPSIAHGTRIDIDDPRFAVHSEVETSHAVLLCGL